MTACPVPNPFDERQLTGLADLAAERIRRAVEIWCRGERLRLDGDTLAAIQVFREAAALGLLSDAGRGQQASTLPHPRVLAGGLSGELLLAIRDAIGQATRQHTDERDEHP